METVVLVVAILAAVLVMASGVWVAIVLITTVAHVRPPAPSGPKGEPEKNTIP